MESGNSEKRFFTLHGEHPTLEKLLNEIPDSVRLISVYSHNGWHVAWLERMPGQAPASDTEGAPAAKRKARNA